MSQGPSGEAGIRETRTAVQIRPTVSFLRKQLIFLLCSQPLSSGKQGEEQGQVTGYTQDGQLAFFRNKKHFRLLLPWAPFGPTNVTNFVD